MNLILLEDSDFKRPGRVVLKGRRFKHLTSVNRVKSGDMLAIGLLNSRIGQGRVMQVKGASIELKVERMDRNPPEPLPLTLVLALPRPKMFKRIVEAATSLGVKQLHLINSWRVEKSYWQTPVISEENISEYVRNGLAQAKDTMVPDIRLHRFFTPFVKQALPTLAEGTLKIVAHPKGDTACPAGASQPVTLVIGPEGGFIDIEIETFKTAGFKICHAGERILRVETAVTFLISRLFTG